VPSSLSFGSYGNRVVVPAVKRTICQVIDSPGSIRSLVGQPNENVRWLPKLTIDRTVFARSHPIR